MPTPSVIEHRGPPSSHPADTRPAATAGIIDVIGLRPMRAAGCVDLDGAAVGPRAACDAGDTVAPSEDGRSASRLSAAMMAAFLCLIGCELVGEVIRDAIGLPVPGTVVGMFLLAALLTVRSGKSGAAIPPAMERTAQGLIDLLGLLFVPAGVGIIAEAWTVADRMAAHSRRAGRLDRSERRGDGPRHALVDAVGEAGEAKTSDGPRWGSS